MSVATLLEFKDPLEGALWVAQKYGVKLFPVARESKDQPHVDKFWEKASNEEGKILVFSKRYPGCNFAVSTTGLLVVDVDDGGDIGIEDLKQKGIIFPPTLTVLTPSGGRHYYFRTDKEIANSVRKIACGIDIRGYHGYVVAPGSRVNGVPYRVVGEQV